jgi:hypothetical protein
MACLAPDHDYFGPACHVRDLNFQSPRMRYIIRILACDQFPARFGEAAIE